jgi:4-hydroxy-tetrahydrodipicolinate reductase
MKLALIGYGKMGKAIEQIALERGHEIIAIVNSQHPIESVDFSDVDVAIEFSTPTSVLQHIHFLLENKIPCVIGTTGWNDQLEEISIKTKHLQGALLHASNFSIGVNLFFKLNEVLATLMNGNSDYKAEMEEIHHTQKLDAPSGTAITLAEGIINHHPAYNDWNCPQSEKNHTSNSSVCIAAIREPGVPGTHSIRYSSPIDTITITHEAHNRMGFATGAIIAAEWLKGKQGVFTMRDVLNIH